MVWKYFDIRIIVVWTGMKRERNCKAHFSFYFILCSQEAIQAEVATLLSLKTEYKELTGQDAIPAPDQPAKKGKSKDNKDSKKKEESTPKKKDKKNKAEKEKKPQAQNQENKNDSEAASSTGVKKITK